MLLIVLYAISRIYGIYGYEGLYIFVCENNFSLFSLSFESIVTELFFVSLRGSFRFLSVLVWNFGKKCYWPATVFFRVVSSSIQKNLAILRHGIPFSFPHSFVSRDQHERDLKGNHFCYVCPHTRKFNGKEKEPEKLS